MRDHYGTQWASVRRYDRPLSEQPTTHRGDRAVLVVCVLGIAAYLVLRVVGVEL